MDFKWPREFFHVPRVASRDISESVTIQVKAAPAHREVKTTDVDIIQSVMTAMPECKSDAASALWVSEAINVGGAADGKGLRRYGTRMSADDLRANGMRGNTICTHEFLQVLSPIGRQDPSESAHHIMSQIGARYQGIRRRGEYLDHGFQMVEVIPNNMAAGPCQACLTLAKKPISSTEAPLGPLDECPHPNQCRLWTRAILEFD